MCLKKDKDEPEEKKDKEKLKRSKDFFSEEEERYHELLENNI